MREERKKIWIHTIQTKLFVRLAVYWIVSQFSLWNLVFIWRLIQEGPGNPLEQAGRFYGDYLPAIVGGILLFPILAWDTVKFTHRVVGPIYRIRKTMQTLASGEPVQPVRLRQNDFLTEMRDDFNQMLETLQRQGAQVLKPADPDKQNHKSQPA